MARIVLWAMAAAFISSNLAASGEAASGQEARVIYSWDFEQGPGIFRLQAQGPGFAAQLDRTTARSGRQSVRLVDAGGDDAPLAWMREWENWGKKANRAALQWARHWNPDRPILLRKGHTYEVRAHLKTQEVHGAGIVAAVWSKSGSPVRGHPERYSPILKGTCDWCWVSARIACTSGGGELSAVTIAPLGKGTVWVDDVLIVEYPETDSESVNYGRYPPLRLEEVRAQTASCLALEFIGDLHCLKAEQPENWQIQSEDDRRFAPGLRPVKVGRTKQLDNPDGTLFWADTYRHTIFLLLPRPLEPGKHYRIVMRNVGMQREEFPIGFDLHKSVSRSIKINQYGYSPGARKYAYVGDWLGSAGHLPLDECTEEFCVVDEKSGRVAFRGTPKLRMRHDKKESWSTSTEGNLSGEDVYELDFSPLTTPGHYFVVIPGVGRSLGFRLAGDVYAEPFYRCARAIFHQRCGVGLTEPCSQYPRKPCHRTPAMEISATIVEHGSEDEDELVKKDPAVKTGKTLEAWGDYHDAADYDRLIGHVRIPAVLLTLYEMFPHAFTDGQLNLPESGNGIPDLVDEARWGVDFWARMQDEDGGVRGGAGPNAVVTAPPDRDHNPIYVYSKDPLSSLSLAAIAAQMARVLDDLGRKPESAFYLRRAEKAWKYGIGRGGEKFNIACGLAAAELFKTTGRPEYHEVFLKEKPAEWDTVAQERHLGHFAWNAWMSYATCRRPAVDGKVQQACRQRIVSMAERELEHMESFAYRMPYTGVGGRPLRYGWACGTNFFSGGEFCIMAWRLTGQKRYRDGALLAGDASLGCHPTGLVFITGVGQRHVRWALHPCSNPLAAKIGSPVRETLPGIPIFGVHAYPLGFGGWQSQLLYVYGDPSAGSDNFYPPAQNWPDLRLFADVGWVPILSEFSVSSTMLHTVFLYGGLLSAERPPE